MLKLFQEMFSRNRLSLEYKRPGTLSLRLDVPGYI